MSYSVPSWCPMPPRPPPQGRTSLLKGPPVLGGIGVSKLDYSDLISGGIPDWKTSALDKGPFFL